MQVSDEVEVFAYEAGEEVVAALAGVEAFDVDRCAMVPGVCMPAWTIGRIVARAWRGGRPAYVLRFRHHGAACFCVAGEDAIEGTA